MVVKWSADDTDCQGKTRIKTDFYCIIKIIRFNKHKDLIPTRVIFLSTKQAFLSLKPKNLSAYKKLL